VRKIKRYTRYRFGFRQFSLSNTLHFQASIFRYTQFSVRNVNTSFSIFTYGSSVYIPSDQLKRFINTALFLVMDVCHSVSILRSMLTMCRWVVFAYALFTVHVFHETVGLDYNIYKYFVLTSRFRIASAQLLYPGTRYRKLISIFSIA
jgi:hypothetical protein